MKKHILIFLIFLAACDNALHNEIFTYPFSTVSGELPFVKCVRAVFLEKKEVALLYSFIVEFSEPVTVPPSGGIYIYGVNGDIKDGVNKRSEYPSKILDFDSLFGGKIYILRLYLAQDSLYYLHITTDVVNLSGKGIDGEKYDGDGCSSLMDELTGNVDGVRVADITRYEEDFKNLPSDYLSLSLSTGPSSPPFRTLKSFMHPKIEEIFLNGRKVKDFLTGDGKNISDFSLYGIGERIWGLPVFTFSLTVPSGGTLRKISARLGRKGGENFIPFQVFNEKEKKWVDEIPDYLDSLTFSLRPRDELSPSIYILEFNSAGMMEDEFGIKFVDGKFDGDDVFRLEFSINPPGLPRVNTLILDPSSIFLDETYLRFGFITPDGTEEEPFGRSDLISATSSPRCEKDCRISRRISLRPSGKGDFLPRTLFEINFNGEMGDLFIPSDFSDDKGNLLDSNADGIREEGERVLQLKEIAQFLKEEEFKKFLLNDIEREPDDSMENAFPFLGMEGWERRKTTDGDVDFVYYKGEGYGYLILENLFLKNLMNFASGILPYSLTFSFQLLNSAGESLKSITSTAPVSSFSISLKDLREFYLRLSCSGENCNLLDYFLRVFVLPPGINEPVDDEPEGSTLIFPLDISNSISSPHTSIYSSTIAAQGDNDWYYFFPDEGNYCLYLLDTGGMWENDSPSVNIYNEILQPVTSFSCSTPPDPFVLSCTSFHASKREGKIYIKIFHSLSPDEKPYSFILLKVQNKCY